MRFRQLDIITELEPGRRIVALRTLRAEEDYLRDHFPHFPVMPGVMMLEACYQAAMWMIHTGDDFAYPLVIMRQAKQVKFGDFLAPGETLEIFAETMKEDGAEVTVKVFAKKGEKTTVSARLILLRQSTGMEPRGHADKDVAYLARVQFQKMYGDSPGVLKGWRPSESTGGDADEDCSQPAVGRLS
jgi:3-hydroxyacyl-[acyl-carrier-protein] dehydratase